MTDDTKNLGEHICSAEVDTTRSAEAAAVAPHAAPSHTPGPWKASTNCSVLIGDKPDIVPSHVARRFVREDGCRVTQFIADCNTALPEHAANAHLISAAPEMYEALKRLMRITERDLNGIEYVAFDIDSKMANDVNAAIAKAEGRQP